MPPSTTSGQPKPHAPLGTTGVLPWRPPAFELAQSQAFTAPVSSHRSALHQPGILHQCAGCGVWVPMGVLQHAQGCSMQCGWNRQETRPRVILPLHGMRMVLGSGVDRSRTLCAAGGPAGLVDSWRVCSWSQSAPTTPTTWAQAANAVDTRRQCSPTRRRCAPAPRQRRPGSATAYGVNAWSPFSHLCYISCSPTY